MSTSKRGRHASRGLPTVHARAAGLDVGSTFHVVAVPPEQSDEPVRTFRSFTGDLYRLADWLQEAGVTTIAMESTGVYWIPVFEILEARGFEVLLVNARDVKNVPGRKTASTTRSGSSNCISMACCAGVSARTNAWFGCARCSAIDKAWRTRQRPRSS
jgi:hypothetical protein